MKCTDIQVGWSKMVRWHRHGAEAQNFAWKFVWIFRTKVQNYKNIKVQKNTKVFITEPCFELQTSDFAWKFVWIFRTNYKSKKLQKVHKYS